MALWLQLVGESYFHLHICWGIIFLFVYKLLQYHVALLLLYIIIMGNEKPFHLFA